MTTIAIPRGPLRAPSRRAVGEAAVGFGVAGVAAGLTWLVEDQGTARGIGAVALAVVGFWFAATRRTTLALALLMVYVGALDGYLKLSTGVGAVTLVRDGLLFAIVVGLLLRAQIDGTSLKAPPMTAWIVGFVLVVAVQFLNPQAGTFTHSLAGARQHLEFVPLFFLTFAFVRTTRALRGFVILLLLIAAANGVVGLMQLRLTRDEMAAWGPGYAERVLNTGRFADAGRTFYSKAGTDQIRPFGLGSDAGAGGVVGAFALGGVLALAARLSRLRYLLLAVAMAIGATLAVVTSQGRGAVVAAAIVVFAYAVLATRSRGGLKTVLGIGVGALVGVLVIAAVVGSVGSSSLRYQGLSASRIVQTTDSARGSSIAQIPWTIAHYPLGAGLATAGAASGTAGGSELTGALDAETWYSFMTLETGVAGMLLVLAFTVTLLVLGFRRCRDEPDEEARVLLAAIIAPVAAILALYIAGGGLTATTPAGPYLWAAGGIVAYWLVARPAARRRGLRVA